MAACRTICSRSACLTPSGFRQCASTVPLPPSPRVSSCPPGPSRRQPHLLGFGSGRPAGSRQIARSASAQSAPTETYDAAYCMPADVRWNNSEHELYTVFTTEVQDYPGLVRVIAWVINGLELQVEGAQLRTTDDGLAQNTFHITDDRGRKLSDDRADLVAERLAEYTTFCTPGQRSLACETLTSGQIRVNNKEHAEYTVVEIAGEHGSNTLLEIASAVTGAGARIHAAEVTGSQGTAARLHKFWVSDKRRNKLDYERAAALIYTLSLVFGTGNGSLHPPGTEFAE